MSVIMMSTYDFSPSQNFSCVNKPPVFPTQRPPPPVSAGGAAVTPKSEVPAERPQCEGGRASSATAPGTGGGSSTGWVQDVISWLYREWEAPGLLLAQVNFYPLCSYLLADAEDAACGCP